VIISATKKAAMTLLLFYLPLLTNKKQYYLPVSRNRTVSIIPTDGLPLFPEAGLAM
jgi:hypothetical protein